jgi:hypothetical protein
MGAIRLQKKVAEERKRLGIDAPQPASPSIAQPLLEAALNETRPKLQDIWARLIVTATDPKRAHLVRRSFIDALKKFDPYDALVLLARHELGDHQFALNVNIYDEVGRKTNVSRDEVYLSVDHLVELSCADKSPTEPGVKFNISRYGKAFLRACLQD